MILKSKYLQVFSQKNKIPNLTFTTITLIIWIVYRGRLASPVKSQNVGVRSLMGLTAINFFLVHSQIVLQLYIPTF